MRGSVGLKPSQNKLKIHFSVHLKLMEAVCVCVGVSLLLNKWFFCFSVSSTTVSQFWCMSPLHIYVSPCKHVYICVFEKETALQEQGNIPHAVQPCARSCLMRSICPGQKHQTASVSEWMHKNSLPPGPAISWLHSEFSSGKVNFIHRTISWRDHEIISQYNLLHLLR